MNEVDKNKLRRKLQFIRQQMKDLRRFDDMELDEFTSDPIYEAAAVRMLQVAVEAILDICSHLSAREGWGLPSTYTEAVGLAADHGMIPRELEHTFKAMARFRNRVVHLYEDIDSEEILDIIRNHREDFRPLIERVARRYLGNC